MRHVVALTVLLLLAGGTLSAATFEPITDAELTARAQLIVVGDVLDSAWRVRADGVIVTDYRLAVRDVLKGQPPAIVTITEVGGTANGIIMAIPGSAAYEPGSRVLAFLKPGKDGTWFTSHMALGQFRFAKTKDGVEVLRRDMDGIEIDDPLASAPRFADAFVEQIKAVAAGLPVPKRDVIASGAVVQDKFVPETNLVAADYVLISDPPGAAPPRPIRWPGCEDGCLIGFFTNGTQPGVDWMGGIDDAMDAWTNHADSFVTLGRGGTSLVTDAAVFDEENTIVLNNTTTVQATICDGSIGCALVWGDLNGDFGPPTHVLRGTTFYSAFFADVVIRPGSFSQNFFEGLVAHELGHAMALRHAPSSGALMSSSLSSSVTASLKTYDKAAMAEVYGAGAPCDPPVITGTGGGGTVPFNTTKQLSVTVTGTGPFTYAWFEGTSGNTGNPVGANSDKFTTPPITSTKNYWVRVTSQCGTLVSVNSSTITVTAESCTVPAVQNQPLSQRVTPGSTATLTVSATGTSPLTYRWYQSSTVGDDSTQVGTNATFVTPPLNTTTSYWARISNNCGSANSALATITVGTQCVPVTLLAEPGSVTVGVGSGVTLNVTPAGDGPFSYQWYQGESPDESNPITIATSQTLALPVFTAAGQFKYWVKVTNPCGTATSRTAVITVSCSGATTPEIAAPQTSHIRLPYDVEWTGELARTPVFELQEATNAGFSDNLRTFTVTGSLHRRFDPHTECACPSDTRFYYRVRGINGCNQEATPYSIPTNVLVTVPLPSTSTEFSVSVPDDATQTFTQDLLVPGFGETATNNDTFAITTDAPWLTVFPPSGALSAGGTTVQLTIHPSGVDIGSTTATIQITRTQGSAKGPVSLATTSASLPFTVSKVTPVTPLPRGLTPPPGTLIIPAIAHADGIGTRFQSDVRITNASGSEIQYELSYTPTQSNGTTIGKQLTLGIGANETKGLDDVVKAWYGSGVLGDLGLGTLEIRPLGGASPASTFASSRTYAISSTGTLGQYIPAIPLDSFIDNLIANPLSKISLQQVANSAAYRTNFGFVEGSGAFAQIRVTLRDGSNNILQQVERSVQPYGHDQARFADVFGNVPLTDGRVEVEVLSTGGKVTAYASVIDNNTQDPLLVFPVQPLKNAATRIVVPGVAELENGVASNFHTDMRVYNASQSSVPVTLSYFPQAGDPTPRPANVTLTLAPGEVKAFNNILPSLWSLAGTGGAVAVVTPSDSNLVVTARTYSRDSAGGTYGQFIPGVTTRDAVGLGERALQVLQLEQSQQYRTNLGLVEVTGNPVTLEIQGTTGNKVTATTSVTLAGNEFRQLGRVFEGMGLTNVYTGRITVKVIGGAGRVAAYGSVVDNRTVDPTYVPSQ